MYHLRSSCLQQFINPAGRCAPTGSGMEAD